MAQPAHRHPHAQPEAAQALAPGWSGDVHGPVAELHRVIEDRYSAHTDLSATPFVERPVEAIVRRTSRAAGWLVLAAAFFVTFRLVA